ncbi:hypothetical protein [Calothrix sp. UHCC 0171]|uniref:hypothetical protein n=1 Tax=Calothrix sp. UHCC 0171 TaxID=3110245 RepID=UPI002B212258|nr:hypothetical protein [Calothrix sp. UHCC 0171]MEA5572540.1 hypothetical protein [Calothrix sp. UHCC 0171]
MKILTKRLTIATLSTAALLIPFFGVIPGVPNWGEMTSAITALSSANAQNIQKQPMVKLQLGAEKQVLSKDIQGKTKTTWQALQGQVTVQPGDVLRYTLTGANQSDRPVKNLTFNQPIPRGMVYILKSANANTNAKITYSIDGGRSFVENPRVKVTLPNGKVEEKPAPAEVYTHIRWNFPNAIAAKSAVNGIYQLRVR